MRPITYRVLLKFWGVPGYAHMDMVPFLENFSWAFARMDPLNISAEFEVRGFTRS